MAAGTRRRWRRGGAAYLRTGRTRRRAAADGADLRPAERRVGRECGSRWSREREGEKEGGREEGGEGREGREEREEREEI